MNAAYLTAESELTRSYLFSPVAQTFLSAGSGEFPVPSSRRPRKPTELESSLNPQAGKPALHAARTSQRDVPTTLNTYECRADSLRFGMARIAGITNGVVQAMRRETMHTKQANSSLKKRLVAALCERPRVYFSRNPAAPHPPYTLNQPFNPT